MKALTPPRLLAATAAACFLLPSCQRNSEARNDPQWWRLEADRIEVANQVELFELKLSNQKAGSQGVVSAAKLEAEVKRSASRRLELAAERDALKQDIDIAKADMEAMKLEWMRTARTAATGREFATFTGVGGRTYENAVVTRVTDVGVEFRHDTGTARLAASELTPAQHEMFGLDREIAGEAIRQEKETALAYHSNVDAVVAAREANEEKDEKRVSIAAASKPAPRETPSFASASVEPRSRLAEAPRSVGRVRSGGSSTVYYSSYYYRPYYYRGYYAPVRRSGPVDTVVYDPYSYSNGAARVPSRTYKSYGGSGSYSPKSNYPTKSSYTPSYNSRSSFVSP